MLISSLKLTDSEGVEEIMMICFGNIATFVKKIIIILIKKQSSP